MSLPVYAGLFTKFLGKFFADLNAATSEGAKICWEYVDAFACGLAPIRQVCRR